MRRGQVWKIFDMQGRGEGEFSLRCWWPKWANDGQSWRELKVESGEEDRTIQITNLIILPPKVRTEKGKKG